MTLAERGLYREMLDWQFEDGALPDDPVEIAAMVGAPVADVEACWPKVRAMFEVRGGVLVNVPFQEKEAAYKAYRKRQSKSGKRGNEVRWNNRPAKRQTAKEQPDNRDRTAIAKRPPASASALQDQDQTLKPSVPSGRADPSTFLAIERTAQSGNGHAPSPGQVAQALVGYCIELHTAAGIEVSRRDRGQWAGVAKRLALDRSPQQVALAVAGMDHGGGKLWRFHAENPERVPWNLFHLEQFFTTAVAAGRNRLVGPQRAEDDFEARVRRTAASLR
jgi:hypothetical protein